MKKVIVYFHGYNSTPTSDKVIRLKQSFSNDYVYSFAIDIDPRIAIIDLQNSIDNILVDHLNEDIKLIFVGTSLGGWWASKLAKIYGCVGIIINACYDPQISLRKYGVSDDILQQYHPMEFCNSNYYFVALHDEVIDPKIDLSLKHINVYDDVAVKHRFNGPEFDDVLELIENM